MIKTSLVELASQLADADAIGRADVLRVGREILPDGIETRDEADMLIALDRAVLVKDASWSAYVIQAVVDFVVWTSRPTGYVDREAARWLVASLSAGEGPTAVAAAIAFEVVREAEGCDEALTGFAMRAAACAGKAGAGRRDLARAA